VIGESVGLPTGIDVELPRSPSPAIARRPSRLLQLSPVSLSLIDSQSPVAIGIRVREPLEPPGELLLAGLAKGQSIAHEQT
jgi:hypothetical protein